MLEKEINKKKRHSIEGEEYSPRLTVGIMAYNEEKHLAETIQSILQQGFSDYKIIIADNASEDKTGEIALEYARRYPHIHYIRHSQNIGALQNFNSLVGSAQGEYFILAGAHDLWSKTFLSSLVEALDHDQNAVIAYAPTEWLDDAGRPLKRPTGFIDTSGSGPVERFNMVMWGNQNALYGAYRLSALRKTRLQLEIVGSGAVMLGELAIQGSFIVVPEATWFRRMNREPESREEKLRRYYNTLFSKRRRLMLPHWRIPPAYITAAMRGRMRPYTRLLLMLSASTSLIRYGFAMVKDVTSLLRRIRTGEGLFPK